MPRYRFDVHHLEDGEYLEDNPAGVELPDDAAAQEFALRSSADLWRTGTTTGKAGRWRLQSVPAECGGFHLIR
jgi:hypothetical protein